MDVFYCDHPEVPLPDGHRFPMEKYRLLREALVERRLLMPQEVHEAPAVELDDLLRVHAAEYVDAVMNGTLPDEAVKRIGFPWSEQLVRRCLASVGGTVAAAEMALLRGAAGNLAGGTHHAHRDAGSGYCVFNDIAVAARRLLDAGKVQRVLVFDVDVHQGDGTAGIFADDPRVFTCSLHGEKNFPMRKATSDLDVALPDDTGDAAYLEALADTLVQALATSSPDIVFYQGGVDGLAEDKLGRLALTHDGLKRRDALVLMAARQRQVPVVLTLGGGYAQPLEATIEAHAGTYAVAQAVFGSAETPTSEDGRSSASSGEAGAR